MTCFSINVMLNYLWTNNMSDNRLLKYNFAKNNDDADPCQAHLAPIISKKMCV